MSLTLYIMHLVRGESEKVMEYCKRCLGIWQAMVWTYSIDAVQLLFNRIVRQTSTGSSGGESYIKRGRPNLIWEGSWKMEEVEEDLGDFFLIKRREAEEPQSRPN